MIIWATLLSSYEMIHLKNHRIYLQLNLVSILLLLFWKPFFPSTLYRQVFIWSLFYHLTSASCILSKTHRRPFVWRASCSCIYLAVLKCLPRYLFWLKNCPRQKCESQIFKNFNCSYQPLVIRASGESPWLLSPCWAGRVVAACVHPPRSLLSLGQEGPWRAGFTNERYPTHFLGAWLMPSCW